MSRALALVKFDDDTVMYACYDGTSDYLYPWLLSEEDYHNKFDSNIFIFNEYCFSNYDKMNRDRDEIHDSEHCEIYVDYGDGSMWLDQTASRSAMYITSPHLEYTDAMNNGVIIDDDIIKQWVIDFHIQNGMDIEMFSGRIEKPQIVDGGFRLISEERIPDDEISDNDDLEDAINSIRDEMEVVFAILDSLGSKVF